MAKGDHSLTTLLPVLPVAVALRGVVFGRIDDWQQLYGLKGVKKEFREEILQALRLLSDIKVKAIAGGRDRHCR